MIKNPSEFKALLSILDRKPAKSIICLNGELPDIHFFDYFASRLPIIAADGAANQLDELGMTIQAIIGDCDSLNLHLKQGKNVCYRPNQNQSDFEKTVEYLNQQHLLPAIITGINGYYLDHVLNNINIFSETNCLLYAPPIIGWMLQEKETIHLQLPIHTKLSLLGMPQAIITSHGLKWELIQKPLIFPGENSCFNRTNQNKVEITTEKGRALLLLYETSPKDAGM